jgi:hypothetical protein
VSLFHRFHNLIDQIEVVAHLRCPKYKAGTSLAGDGLGAFDPRGAQLGCLRLERRHRGPHFVQLSGRKARQQCRSCDKESGAKDAYDERFSIDEVIPIHVTSLPQR